MKVLKFNEFLNEALKVKMSQEDKEILKYLEDNLNTKLIPHQESKHMFYYSPENYEKQYADDWFKVLGYSEEHIYVDSGFSFEYTNKSDQWPIINDKEKLLKLIKQNWKFLK